jgi:hypothetical protein
VYFVKRPNHENIVTTCCIADSFTSAGAAPQMCFDQAGKDYQIDPLLLMSISIKESRLSRMR